MSRKRPGLGKGLDALIPRGESALPEKSIIQIPIRDVIPNPRQPRSYMNEEEIAELAASIQAHGVIQPLVVKKGVDSRQFILIAGERRWLAAKEAGLNTVPAVLRDATEQELLELALIENVQRADLNPLEAAEAYRQLSEEFGLSQDEIALRVGKSRVAITNTIRLLKLPSSVQKALTDKRVSEGHARALLGLASSQAQAAALQTVLKKGLTVRQTEDLVRKLSGQKTVRTNKKNLTPELKEIEELLRSHLGTKVALKPKKRGGTVVIHYYSEEELNALLNRLIDNIE